MTESAATKEARRKARRTQRTHYVIWVGEDVGGPYAVADDLELDTFYSGTSDSNILYEATP